MLQHPSSVLRFKLFLLSIVILFLSQTLLAESSKTIQQLSNAKLCEQSANMAITLQEAFFDAVIYCDRAIKNDLLPKADLAGTYVNRGVLYRLMGLNDAAEKDYIQAKRIGGDSASIQLNMGNIALAFGQIKKAIEHYNKAIEMKIDNPHLAYYNRAIAKQKMGRQDEAISDFKKAIEYKPEFTKAINKLEMLLES